MLNVCLCCFNLRALPYLILVSGAFLVSWLPYVLTAFINAFGDPNSVPMFAQCFTPIFAKMQSTFDPILYVGTNKRFRFVLLRNHFYRMFSIVTSDGEPKLDWRIQW